MRPPGSRDHASGGGGILGLAERVEPLPAVSPGPWHRRWRVPYPRPKGGLAALRRGGHAGCQPRHRPPPGPPKRDPASEGSRCRGCGPITARHHGPHRHRAGYAMQSRGRPGHRAAPRVQRRSGGSRRSQASHPGCWPVRPRSSFCRSASIAAPFEDSGAHRRKRRRDPVPCHHAIASASEPAADASQAVGGTLIGNGNGRPVCWWTRYLMATDKPCQHAGTASHSVTAPPLRRPRAVELRREHCDDLKDIPCQVGFETRLARRIDDDDFNAHDGAQPEHQSGAEAEKPVPVPMTRRATFPRSSMSSGRSKPRFLKFRPEPRSAMGSQPSHPFFAACAKSLAFCRSRSAFWSEHETRA